MRKFNVTQAKTVQGRDKAVWIRHGIAFENDQGKVRVKLESIPIPDEKGEIWLSLFEDTGNQSAKPTQPQDDGLDGDILF